MLVQQELEILRITQQWEKEQFDLECQLKMLTTQRDTLLNSTQKWEAASSMPSGSLIQAIQQETSSVRSVMNAGEPTTHKLEKARLQHLIQEADLNLEAALQLQPATASHLIVELSPKHLEQERAASLAKQSLVKEIDRVNQEITQLQTTISEYERLHSHDMGLLESIADNRQATAAALRTRIEMGIELQRMHMHLKATNETLNILRKPQISSNSSHQTAAGIISNNIQEGIPGGSNTPPITPSPSIPQPIQNNLRITIREGRNVAGPSWTNPVCAVFSVSGRVVHTTKVDRGTSPRWDGQFEIPIQNNHDNILNISVQDPTKSGEALTYGQVDLSALPFHRIPGIPLERWVELYNIQRHLCGYIVLGFERMGHNVSPIASSSSVPLPNASSSHNINSNPQIPSNNSQQHLNGSGIVGPPGHSSPTEYLLQSLAEQLAHVQMQLNEQKFHDNFSKYSGNALTPPPERPVDALVKLSALEQQIQNEAKARAIREEEIQVGKQQIALYKSQIEALTKELEKTSMEGRSTKELQSILEAKELDLKRAKERAENSEAEVQKLKQELEQRQKALQVLDQASVKTAEELMKLNVILKAQSKRLAVRPSNHTTPSPTLSYRYPQRSNTPSMATPPLRTSYPTYPRRLSNSTILPNNYDTTSVYNVPRPYEHYWSSLSGGWPEPHYNENIAPHHSSSPMSLLEDEVYNNYNMDRHRYDEEDIMTDSIIRDAVWVVVESTQRPILRGVFSSMPPLRSMYAVYRMYVDQPGIVDEANPRQLNDHREPSPWQNQELWLVCSSDHPMFVHGIFSQKAEAYNCRDSFGENYWVSWVMVDKTNSPRSPIRQIHSPPSRWGR